MTGTATIDNVYATGDVRAVSSGGTNALYNGIGGLIGSAYINLYDSALNISNAFATGDVTTTANAGTNIGALNAGGLLGYVYAGGYTTLTGVYATGNVTGATTYTNVGGLIGGGSGANAARLAVSNAYAAGDVTGGTRNGGLMGNVTTATVTGAYSKDADSRAGALTADQLADAGVRNAIVSGGDVQGAVTNYEFRQEQIRQDAIARAAYQQAATIAVASIADDQRASIAQLAAIGEQAFGIPELTPIDLSNAIHDFTPSQTNRSGRSYSASVKEVTVDGVTYLVDDDEEKEN
jgi:hypothetical protein